jgi:hypothetical protein
MCDQQTPPIMPDSPLPAPDVLEPPAGGNSCVLCREYAIDCIQGRCIPCIKRKRFCSLSGYKQSSNDAGESSLPAGVEGMSITNPVSIFTNWNIRTGGLPNARTQQQDNFQNHVMVMIEAAQSILNEHQNLLEKHESFTAYVMQQNQIFWTTQMKITTKLDSILSQAGALLVQPSQQVYDGI